MCCCSFGVWLLLAGITRPGTLATALELNVPACVGFCLLPSKPAGTLASTLPLPPCPRQEVNLAIPLAEHVPFARFTCRVSCAVHVDLTHHHTLTPCHTHPHNPHRRPRKGRRKRRVPRPLPACSVACVVQSISPPLRQPTQNKHGHSPLGGHRGLVLSGTQPGEVCHHDGQAGTWVILSRHACKCSIVLLLIRPSLSPAPSSLLISSISSLFYL